MPVQGVDPDYTHEKIAGLRVMGGLVEFCQTREPTRDYDREGGGAQEDWAASLKQEMQKHAAR